MNDKVTKQYVLDEWELNGWFLLFASIVYTWLIYITDLKISFAILIMGIFLLWSFSFSRKKVKEKNK